MSFSQRKGIEPTKLPIQNDSIDQGLRNGLWDALTICLLENVQFTSYDKKVEDCSQEILAKRLYHSYWKIPTDKMPAKWRDFRVSLREYFFGCEWNKVYDILEFILVNVDDSKYGAKAQVNRMIDFINRVLERDNSTFRLVENKFIDVVDTAAIDAIAQAAAQSKYSAAAAHFKSAIQLLYDRSNPDYRNSIKESISAVESASRVAICDPKATLGQALKIIGDKIHPALRDGISKIYGYTSDEAGIRHAMTAESKTTKSEAQFVLTVCSAIVNLFTDKL